MSERVFIIAGRLCCLFCFTITTHVLAYMLTCLINHLVSNNAVSWVTLLLLFLSNQPHTHVSVFVEQNVPWTRSELERLPTMQKGQCKQHFRSNAESCLCLSRTARMPFPISRRICSLEFWDVNYHSTLKELSWKDTRGKQIRRGTK